MIKERDTDQCIRGMSGGMKGMEKVLKARLNEGRAASEDGRG
jgi:hypothetical protein